jgi:hypothetical protein
MSCYHYGITVTNLGTEVNVSILPKWSQEGRRRVVAVAAFDDHDLPGVMGRTAADPEASRLQRAAPDCRPVHLSRLPRRDQRIALLDAVAEADSPPCRNDVRRP